MPAVGANTLWCNCTASTVGLSIVNMGQWVSAASRPLCCVMPLLWLVGEKYELSHPHAAHSSREHHCHVLSDGGGKYTLQDVCVWLWVSCGGWMWLRRCGVRTAGLCYYALNLLSSCTSDNRCGAVAVAACSSSSLSVLLLHELHSVRIAFFSSCLSWWKIFEELFSCQKN